MLLSGGCLDNEIYIVEGLFFVSYKLGREVSFYWNSVFGGRFISFREVSLVLDLLGVVGKVVFYVVFGGIKVDEIF